VPSSFRIHRHAPSTVTWRDRATAFTRPIALAGALVLGGVREVGAQPVPTVTPPVAAAGGPGTAPLASAAPVADALAVSLLEGTALLARGTLRLRIERTGTGVDVVATGVLVRPGERITAELRTDTLLAPRRYLAETRDSAGRVTDRVEVAIGGGRMVLTRTSAAHRMVREFPLARALLLVDDAALVPLLVAAAAQPRDSVTVLDVRTGTLRRAVATSAAPTALTIAEVPLEVTPVSLRASDGTLGAWWRDPRGRLVHAPLAGTRQLRRDDPPG
jgi:hypothetical protein